MTVVGHLRRVVPAGNVLSLDLLLGAVERRAVEDARLGEADLLQRLLQRFGVEFLVADDVDLADRRALLDDDDEDAVVFHLEPHVAKETGREQRLHRLRRLLVVETLADLDGQVREHRARLGALDALDADVLDDERLDRRRQRRREPERRDERDQNAQEDGGSTPTRFEPYLKIPGERPESRICQMRARSEPRHSTWKYSEGIAWTRKRKLQWRLT